MKEAGFFDNEMLLFMGFEVLTYNVNYRHAGFQTFYFHKDPAGMIKTTQISVFQTIYPTLYDE